VAAGRQLCWYTQTEGRPTLRHARVGGNSYFYRRNDFARGVVAPRMGTRVVAGVGALAY